MEKIIYIYIESKLVETMVTNVRRLFVKCLKLFANYIFIFHILYIHIVI